MESNPPAIAGGCFGSGRNQSDASVLSAAVDSLAGFAALVSVFVPSFFEVLGELLADDGLWSVE